MWSLSRQDVCGVGEDEGEKQNSNIKDNGSQASFNEGCRDRSGVCSKRVERTTTDDDPHYQEK